MTLQNIYAYNTLFETNDYKELKKWIEEHSAEIQSQVDKKKEEWIEKYSKYL